MIAKQAIGKSFGGALNYNLKKLYKADKNIRAELLSTNFLSLNQTEIRKEVAIMKAMNPNLNRNTYHTSLNFPVGEKLSNEKMEAIAKEYMEKMGFDNNPYFIFRHHDAEHPHCHLLVLRNRFDGTVVTDSNNYARSEAIVRELEVKFGLITVTASKFSLNKSPDKDELEMIHRTGKASDKMLMQNKVALAISSSKNLDQFISLLEQTGISPLFNQASTGRVSGITFINNHFKVRGQALGNQFKWGNILKNIDYEQARDSKKISEANTRTRAMYSLGRTTATSHTTRTDRTFENFDGTYTSRIEKSNEIDEFSESTPANKDHERGNESAERFDDGKIISGTEEDGMDTKNDFFLHTNSPICINSNNNISFGLEIVDDEDDSKKRRKMKR